MAEQEDLELTFHHKPIKTTDTYRATLAENNLQTRTMAVIQKKATKDYTESGRKEGEMIQI